MNFELSVFLTLMNLVLYNAFNEKIFIIAAFVSGIGMVFSYFLDEPTSLERDDE